MSAYHIWNPSLILRPPALETSITHGEHCFLADGTPDFVRGVLAAAGVAAAPNGWTMTPCLARYYNDYVDDEEWREQWAPVFRLRAALAELPGRVLSFAEGWHGLDVMDKSWTTARDTELEVMYHCLVVADFRDEDARARAEAAIAEDARRREQPAPSISHATANGRWPQLLIDLGHRDDAFYEAGAPEATRVADICREQDASLHYLTTSRW